MRFKAIVRYDGTSYAGWQKQNKAITIQETIEKAIEKITCEKINIVGSGRTDGKVHAFGQVFHFDCDKKINDFAKAINSQLPDDIFIVSVEEIDPSFHARFSAIGKHYQYWINNGTYNPMMRHYSCFISQKLDIEAMNQAKNIFIGCHDFTSFNATKISEDPNQIRTITSIEIIKENDMIKLSFQGDGFMRYMIRMLSATLIEVGLHHIEISDVEKMLLTKDKTACHYNGQPQGLYLMEVYY